uniref:F-box domain-containing protein n=1 Tax=Steinernema glaseri TaxID=37863 RepID=A0A1I7YA16_9BILA
MESVPVAFVDTVCHRLEYRGYLRSLTELRSHWSSTAETHYKKRRRFTLYLIVNDDGTQVGMEIRNDGMNSVVVPFTSLSKYDRIAMISVGDGECVGLHEKMPLNRFRTKALPLLASLACSYRLKNAGSVGPYKNLMELLFSSLRGHVIDLCTWNSGGECLKFIEEQVDLGHIKKIELSGEEGWPQSLKSTFKSFMKSPMFRLLDIFGTNLNVDLDMVTCLVERFVKGDLPSDSLLFGTPSFTPEMLRGVHQESITTDCSNSDLFYDDLRSPVSDFINWTGPGPLTLSAVFFEDGHFFIEQYTHYSCDCSLAINN